MQNSPWTGEESVHGGVNAASSLNFFEFFLMFTFFQKKNAFSPKFSHFSKNFKKLILLYLVRNIMLWWYTMPVPALRLAIYYDVHAVLAAVLQRLDVQHLHLQDRVHRLGTMSVWSNFRRMTMEFDLSEFNDLGTMLKTFVRAIEWYQNHQNPMNSKH